MRRHSPIVVVGLLLAGCAEARQPLVSGAYVQDVTTSSAVVREITQRVEVRGLEVGPGPEGPFQRQMETEPGTNHAFALTGLEADRFYSYRLLDSFGTPVQVASFRTAPPPGRRPIRFVAVSDTGANEPTYRGLHPLDEVVEGFTGGARDGGATLALVNGEPPRLHARLVRTILETTPDAEVVLHGGDLVGPNRQRGDYTESFFEPFALLIDHVPIYPAMGNHDANTSRGVAWEQMFPEKHHYSFDRGDVHFVALDMVSESIDPGSPQRAFLEDDLARTKAAWKVVYLHVPIFTETRTVDNTPLVEGLVPLLVQRKVDLVLSGNEHAYQRFKPMNGVTYVVMGPGGQPETRFVNLTTGRLAAAGSIHSYVRGTADAHTLTLDALDIEGRVIDSAVIGTK